MPKKTPSKKLSAASLRALNYTKGPEWYCDFRSQALTGDLAEVKEGVVRRDPSSVILVDGLYHVWYSKSLGLTIGFDFSKTSGNSEAKVFPWDLSEIWHATSEDGWHWIEEG